MKIALTGNPNSGKSSLFNIITGLRQKVSNYPGITVDKKSGVIEMLDQKVKVIDFPGLYSLHATSTEEKIVTNILTNPQDDNFPDLLIYVADATNLERHFLLCTQLLDLKIPMIIAINMIDLVDDPIDISELQELCQVPVVPISSHTRQGIIKLRETVEHFMEDVKSEEYIRENGIYKFSKTEKEVFSAIGINEDNENPYRQKLLAHHHDWLSHLTDDQVASIKSITSATDFQDLKSQVDETMSRFDIISRVTKKTVRSVRNMSLTDKVDRLITHPIWGPLIFILIMLLMFQSVYSWADTPMTWIENGFAALGQTIRTNMAPSWFTDLLVDGAIAGLAGVMVFIPQITILFLLISFLEEVGYMSRAVFLFDGLMHRFGLNGRSIVALVSSGACAIPAIMSTRSIANWKERLTTIMVAPLISCSARIPVYAILIGFVVPQGKIGIFNQRGLVFMGLYLLGILAALISALFFKWILKSDESSFLMMELPYYKKPQLRNVLLIVNEKVFTFVKEAGKIIFIISIVLWFLASYGPSSAMEAANQQADATIENLGLSISEAENLRATLHLEASYASVLGKSIEPIIRPLGFDWKIGIALISSFAAREVFVGTMATIYSVGNTDDELTIREKMAAELRPDGKPLYDLPLSLSLLLFYVFALQCVSTLAITKRETKSWKWPAIQFGYMGVMAYLASLFVFQLLT